MATNSERQSQTGEVPFGMNHPTVVPSNHDPRNGDTDTEAASGSSGGNGDPEPPEDAVRLYRGHVKFAGDAPHAFIDLVRETLEESRYIDTEWDDVDATWGDDELVIQEVLVE